MSRVAETEVTVPALTRDEIGTRSNGLRLERFEWSVRRALGSNYRRYRRFKIERDYR